MVGGVGVVVLNGEVVLRVVRTLKIGDLVLQSVIFVFVGLRHLIGDGLPLDGIFGHDQDQPQLIVDLLHSVGVLQVDGFPLFILVVLHLELHCGIAGLAFELSQGDMWCLLFAILCSKGGLQLKLLQNLLGNAGKVLQAAAAQVDGKGVFLVLYVVPVVGSHFGEAAEQALQLIRQLGINGGIAILLRRRRQAPDDGFSRGDIVAILYYQLAVLAHLIHSRVERCRIGGNRPGIPLALRNHHFGPAVRVAQGF